MNILGFMMNHINMCDLLNFMISYYHTTTITTTATVSLNMNILGFMMNHINMCDLLNFMISYYHTTTITTTATVSIIT